MKILYRIWYILGQHVPGRLGSYILAKGRHWPHVMAMLSPSATLTETMMNHTNFLVHPLDIRSTVIAKEVLLHRAARMEKEPAMLLYSRKGTKRSKLKMDSGRPKPRTTVYETKLHAVASESCSFR